jgi:signal-transduction protein with cAMP-binding, CBS, and nucleotidyltransferase domain
MLDCTIYYEGAPIVEAGEPFTCLYLIYKNKVKVVESRKLFTVTLLPEGSWFGDFNIFCGLKSQYNYVATTKLSREENAVGILENEDKRIMLFSVEKESFIDLCN